MFCDFCHACHELRIFNMLNNFVHEWTLTHSVRAFWAISSGINANAHASLPCFIEVKMAKQSKTSSSSDELESRFSPTSAILTSIKHGKDACAFALIPELIAQNARTLWVNVHSCTKLFNMLNILSSWHAWQKSQNMTPHTWGNSLRQQPRVTLSSADSPSVRRALHAYIFAVTF